MDDAGNVYVTGQTSSSDFPTTPGAFQRTNHGGTNGFVAKLNPTGTALVYSTYLGGSGPDYDFTIAVDASGNAYVGGSTRGNDFPTTPGAFQPTKPTSGVNNATVTELNPSGSALVYSTYLGGNGGANPYSEAALHIAVDSAGTAYVVGTTGSTDFPTTSGAVQTAFGGGSGDAFVTRLNATGSALLYSTYLGGAGDETGSGLAVDSSGNAYISGTTTSANFPTANALQPANAGGQDLFVAELNPTATGLVYSTYVGGSGNDGTQAGTGGALALDSSGNAYVTGFTNSTNFPIANPVQAGFGGGGGEIDGNAPGDAFVTKISASGTALVYSTYLGGSRDDFGRAIAVDGSGNAYVIGSTDSTDFPTANAFQPTYGGDPSDAFIAKIVTGSSTAVAGGTEGAALSSVLSGATFTDANPGDHTADMTATIDWGDNGPTSTGTVSYDVGTGVYTVDGSHTYAEDGSYPISISVADDGGSTTTISGTATVADAVPIAADDAVSMYGQSVTIAASDLLANDSDPGGDPLHVVLVGAPSYGTLLDNGDGTYTYTVGAGFGGLDSFTYQASNGTNLSNLATVNIENMLYVRNTNDSGDGSLRWTIDNANSHPGPDTIQFSIPATDPGFVGGVFVICPQSGLPWLTDDGTTIDGRTQTAFTGDTNPFGPEIVLNGSLAGGVPWPGASVGGLGIGSSNNRVYGLNIQQFSGDGISIGSGVSDCVIQDNYIGTDATGTIALGNGNVGVNIWTTTLGSGCHGNLIGSQDGDPALRNVISGNGLGGVQICPSDSSDNIIAGNYIGVDKSGSHALGNNGWGVENYASSTQIIDNVISANKGGGIAFVGGVSNCVVQGNYIGTDATGSHALGNTGSGVSFSGSGNQVIGNVIAANQGAGISIGTGGSDNVVQGNYIGTDATGTTALGNNGSGIQIWGSGCQGNLTGSLDGDPALRNIISGNLSNGVEIDSSTTAGNIVAGNYIGADATGSHALGNVGGGVAMTGSGTQVVKNVIVGNGASGISMSGAVGSQIVGNVISDNAVKSSGSNGINIGNSVTNSVIQGNYIGTDATGTIAWGNKGYAGIQIWGTGFTGNLIGSEDGKPALRNIISGNAGIGVENDAPSSSGNTIAGNYIGVDATGSHALGNGSAGLGLNGTGNRIIGNVISANHGNGITLRNGVSDSVIQCNYVGTDATGTIPLGNTGYGIEAWGTGCTNNLIGSAKGDPALGNVISANSNIGLAFEGSGSTGNIIGGNVIGTDVTGTVALGNGFGVSWGPGVKIAAGGSDQVLGNVIGANNGAGIDIQVNNNVVTGNFVGTDRAGQLTLGNRKQGILIESTAQSNQIGGSAALANIIAFNSGDGVNVTGTATGNSIRANSIYSNGLLGINLGGDGVTRNHLLNPTAGPNDWQNFPILRLAETGATTHVAGALNSAPNTTYTIDFYANDAADPSGYGEGQYWLGAITVTTDAFGHAPFDQVIAAATAAGQYITATATDPGGNTSEFSTFDTTAPVTTATLAGTAGNDGWHTSAVTVTLAASDPDDAPFAPTTYYTLDGGSPQTYAVPFTISGDGVHTITYWSIDCVGNVETASAQTIGIDTTAPTIVVAVSPASPDSTGWYNIGTGAPTVSFSYSDATSGLIGTLPANYTAPDGDNAAYGVTIYDAAGNSATVNVPELKVNTVAPNTTASLAGTVGSGGSYSSTVTVTLSATDNPSGSGLASTYYTIDSGSPLAYSQPFTMSWGTHTISYWSVDTAGNAESPHSQTLSTSPSICILDPTMSGALNLSGNAGINIPAGTIVVDSSSTSAVSASGNAQIAATSILVVGGVHTSGNATMTGTVTTGASTVADPLANLPALTTTNSGTAINLSGNTTQTINPGAYSSIKVSGNARLTLNPGIYIIAGGGISVTGNASLATGSVASPVTGTGILIYNAGSNVVVGSSGTPSYGGISPERQWHLQPYGSQHRDISGDPYLPGPRQHQGHVASVATPPRASRGTIYAKAALLAMSGNAQLRTPSLAGGGPAPGQRQRVQRAGHRRRWDRRGDHRRRVAGRRPVRVCR